MEENTKKTNVGIIICVLLVIVLLGFIIFDKFLNKDDGCKVSVNTNNSYEVYKKNVIASREKNMNSSNSEFFSNEYSDTTADYTVALESNGDLYLIDLAENKEKIAEKVLLFQYVGVGSGGNEYLYLIKEDGTVSGTTVSRGEKESYKKENIVVTDNVGEFKNVVAIIDGIAIKCNMDICDDNPTFMVIDIDGNMYSYK